MWLVKPTDADVQVLPLDDLKQHVECGSYCHCKPSIKEQGRLIVHNAYDGREFFETPVTRREDN